MWGGVLCGWGGGGLGWGFGGGGCCGHACFGGGGEVRLGGGEDEEELKWREVI